MDIIKAQYKNILLVIGYIAVALGVYITLTMSYNLAWWLILIISLAIVAVGVVIGYFYIKGEMKKTLEAAKPEEAKEEAKEK